MFVVSLISRIAPVLRPQRYLFTPGHSSSGRPSLRVSKPGNACTRHLWVGVVRALLPKGGYAGGSLTTTVCLLIALTIAAIVIAGALSATSVGDELGRAVRLSWWFV
ncbi:hypothetical protein [Burkholderia sp. S171]|uniref:hypothetical protein n=1 Tax=Burkholderia sp. S171 TaxID=1641860 RepID=UPI00131B202F|nr:hypothetical protein [Burkholderia sp. S171]